MDKATVPNGRLKLAPVESRRLGFASRMVMIVFLPGRVAERYGVDRAGRNSAHALCILQAGLPMPFIARRP
jgi:hypothetical protein